MTLGEFEQILLLALIQLGGNAHGAAIRHEIARRTDREPSAGAIYTAMERLQRRGMVTSELGQPTTRRGGKRRRIYQIEPGGREAVHRSLRRLARMSDNLSAEGV